MKTVYIASRLLASHVTSQQKRLVRKKERKKEGRKKYKRKRKRTKSDAPTKKWQTNARRNKKKMNGLYDTKVGSARMQRALTENRTKNCISILLDFC